jgi:hypothetical protein
MPGGLWETLHQDWEQFKAGFVAAKSSENPKNQLSGGPLVHNIHVHTDSKDPKEHAKQVAIELGGLMRHAVHTRSNTHTLPYYSRMEVAPA